MKKISIILLCLSMLLAGTAWAKNQLVREAAEMHQEATYDRHANWQELDAVMQKIAKAQQQKLDSSDQRTVALLSVHILRYQYSLLESPDFQNNRGGWPVLQKAKKIANDWLAQQPRDIEMLHELYATQTAMQENQWPTMHRLLAITPRDPFLQILLAGLYQHEKEYAKAMQAYAKAVQFEKQPKLSWERMENAVMLPADAGCHFAQDLQQLIANPAFRQFNEYDQQIKKSSAYRQALRDAEKIKRQFLRVYHYKNCLKDTP